jgi:hypothetical protein
MSARSLSDLPVVKVQLGVSQILTVDQYSIEGYGWPFIATFKRCGVERIPSRG